MEGIRECIRFSKNKIPSHANVVALLTRPAVCEEIHQSQEDSLYTNGQLWKKRFHVRTSVNSNAGDKRILTISLKMVQLSQIGVKQGNLSRQKHSPFARYQISLETMSPYSGVPNNSLCVLIHFEYFAGLLTLYLGLLTLLNLCLVPAYSLVRECMLDSKGVGWHQAPGWFHLKCIINCFEEKIWSLNCYCVVVCFSNWIGFL